MPTRRSSAPRSYVAKSSPGAADNVADVDIALLDERAKSQSHRVRSQQLRRVNSAPIAQTRDSSDNKSKRRARNEVLFQRRIVAKDRCTAGTALTHESKSVRSKGPPTKGGSRRQPGPPRDRGIREVDLELLRQRHHAKQQREQQLRIKAQRALQKAKAAGENQSQHNKKLLRPASVPTMSTGSLQSTRASGSPRPSTSSTRGPTRGPAPFKASRTSNRSAQPAADVKRAIFFAKFQGQIFKVIDDSDVKNFNRIGALIDTRRLGQGGSGGLVLRFHDGKFPTLAVVQSQNKLQHMSDLAAPKAKPPAKLALRHRTDRYSAPLLNRCPLPHRIRKYFVSC